MQFFDKRVQIKNNKVTEDEFIEIRNTIKECLRYIKDSSRDGVIAVTGPKSLLDKFVYHGKAIVEIGSSDHATSYYISIDGFPFLAVISEEDNVSMVSISAMESSGEMYSIKTGKK